MRYGTARAILIVVGLVVLLTIGGLLYIRGVDPVEVLASLLFIPVFLAFVLGGVAGGVIVGLLAGASYAALRFPAIEVVGIEPFLGVIVSRAVAYVLFGAAGGWANRQLASSLGKLELYDQIDDLTGLFNARFLVEQTHLEMARASRYKTMFSLCVLDVPVASMAPLSRRRRARTLRALGNHIRGGVRTVDRAVHGLDGERHRLAVILPETGAEGARVFAGRMAERVEEFLRHHGASPPESLRPTVATFPGDEEVLREIIREFADLDRHEHPARPGEATRRPLPDPAA